MAFHFYTAHDCCRRYGSSLIIATLLIIRHFVGGGGAAGIVTALDPSVYTGGSASLNTSGSPSNSGYNQGINGNDGCGTAGGKGWYSVLV